MIVNFAKSLDRPVDIFGVKGGWIKIFLIAVGVCVVLGIIIGSYMTAGVGISVAIVGAIACFIACQVIQESVTHRHIDKYPLTGRMKCYVRRKETLSSVLLPDPRYQELKRLEEKRKQLK